MPDPNNPALVYCLSSLGAGCPKPFVLVEIDNAHKQGEGLILPALVDSGADGTCIPRELAERLGHDYDAGDEVPTRGIGGKTIGRKHNMRIRLLGPGAILRDTATWQAIPNDFVIAATCCEAPRNFGLLGCHDFLTHWEFKLRVSSNLFHLTPACSALRNAVAQWRRRLKT